MRIGNTCRCDSQSSSVDELRETILAIHQLNAHWLQRITDLEPDLLGPTTFGPLDTVLDKFVTEYVGYLRLMSLTGISDLVEPARASARDLSGYVRSGHTLLKVARMPDAVIGSAHQMLVSMGVRTQEEFQEAWTDSVTHGTNSEVIPTRQLRRRWAEELEIAASQPWTSHQLTGSILCEPSANIMSLTASDLYCITHSVWYVTDYGRRELPACVDPSALSELIDQSLAHSLAEGNLDLAVEFLMSVLAARLPWSPTCALAWRILWPVWTRHAFVPGGGFEQLTYSSMVGNEQDRYLFSTSQHTTRVFGKLCCLMVQYPGRWNSTDEGLSTESPEPDGAEPPSTDSNRMTPQDASDRSLAVARALAALETVSGLPTLCDADLDLIMEGLVIRLGRAFDLDGLERLRGLRLSPKTRREVEAMTRLKSILTKSRYADDAVQT
jgi:hypothetical protein